MMPLANSIGTTVGSIADSDLAVRPTVHDERTGQAVVLNCPRLMASIEFAIDEEPLAMTVRLGLQPHLQEPADHCIADLQRLGFVLAKSSLGVELRTDRVLQALHS